MSLGKPLDSGPETRFGSIEGAHEYLGLLQRSLDEAKEDVQNQTTDAVDQGGERREKALRLVSYKLTRLDVHVTAGRRLLNDLRTLRRLLYGERLPEGSASAGIAGVHRESVGQTGRPDGGLQAAAAWRGKEPNAP